jgi:hypothetical protein
MIFYTLLPANYDPTRFSYPLLVVEHEQGEGNIAYQGNDNLPFDEANNWFNNATFRGQYPFIILLPACDQTGDTTGGAAINFGGWSPPGDHGANEDSVALCAQWAISNLAVDTSCVGVGGQSLGGIGTWALALDYNAYNGKFGKIFTAFNPMAGVIERNGFGVGPTPEQYAAMTGVPIFAVHGANDGTSQPNWDLAVWSHFSNGAPTTGGPAGAQAGSSAFRLLFDPNLGHDVWDTYRPLPAGKPIYDWLWNTRASGEIQPMPTPSPDNTVVKAGSTATINDASGNVWSITSGNQVARNGVTDTTTNRVTQLAWEKGVIWQENTDLNWYSWTGGGWSQATTVSPIPPTTTPPTPTPPPTGTGTGQWVMTGGKMYDPAGNLFVARGCNVGVDEVTTASTNLQAQPLSTLYPNINHIRLNSGPISGQSGTASAVYPLPYATSNQPGFPQIYGIFIEQCTGYDYSDPTFKLGGKWTKRLGAQNILVTIEDHNGNQMQPPFTGQALQIQAAWYGALATFYLGNPMVGFDTQNEMNSADTTYSLAAIAAMSDSHAAIIGAIRATGSMAPILVMAGVGGSNIGTVGLAAGYKAAVYANERNLVAELHGYYNNGGSFGSLFNTAHGYVEGALTAPGSGGQGGYGIIAAQSIPTLDGVMPVVFGEWGPSDGNQNASNGSQITAELTAQIQNGVGSCAWQYGHGGGSQWDLATNNNTGLTVWGQEVAGLIATKPPTGTVPGTPTPPTPTPPTPTPPPTGGPTVASVQSEIDAVSATLTGAITALTKIRADVALLP